MLVGGAKVKYLNIFQGAEQFKSLYLQPMCYLAYLG
jgi:hypothetical protein